jgi:DNA-directed RNA polymerase subunit M/transcription elongation factor TFIIS
MSNLDAIAKKLKEQQKKDQSTTISTPETKKQKARRQEDCPQCGNRSILKGFCIICGYEAKE